MIQVLSAVLTACSPLIAQSGESSATKPDNQPSTLSAYQIVELSIAATERNWLARDQYTYIERDEDRRLDSLGEVRSEDTEVTNMILVNGARFEQLIEHNGHPPSAEEQRGNAEDLDKL